MGPPDAILGLTEAYKKDSNPKKVNVGAGAYRDDEGKPYVLPVVQTAEKLIMEKMMNHEYSPIAGPAEFCQKAAELALGADNPVLSEGRYATIQTISGTGSLRIGAAFIAAFHEGEKCVHLPKPTWGNHVPIFKHSGMDVKMYKYYDPECISFDFEGCCKDLSVCYCILFCFVDDICEVNLFFVCVGTTKEVCGVDACMCA